MRRRLARAFRRLADRLDPPTTGVVLTWQTKWSLTGWSTGQPQQPTITFQ